MAKLIIKNIKHGCLLIIVLSIAGCKVRLAGTYAPARHAAMSSSVLQVNSDSTFSYSIFNELQSDTFSGQWRQVEDTLLLKVLHPINDDSLLKPDTVISTLSSSLGENVNKIKVLVQDSVPFTLANIFINNSQSALKTDDQGEIFVSENVQRIRIQHQGIRTRTFELDAGLANDFTAFIYDKQFIPLRYLAPIRKWIFASGNLIPLDAANLRLDNYRYKKYRR